MHAMLGPKSLAIKPNPPSRGAVSLSDEAYQMLEEKIITMELAPGVMFSETDLASLIGLGRTPVREALQRLAHEHLVEIVARRGIRIAPMDLKQHIRLNEVRRELETLAASLAARRASTAQRTKLNTLANAFRKSGSRDYLTFLRLDREFNTLVGAACDNPYLSDMLYTLHGLSRRHWHAHPEREEDLVLVAGMHAGIADAIAAKNDASIRKAVCRHMDYVRDLAMSAIGK